MNKRLEDVLRGELIDKLSNLDKDSLNELLTVLNEKVVGSKVVDTKVANPKRKQSRKSKKGVDNNRPEGIIEDRTQIPQPRPQRRKKRRTTEEDRSRRHNRNGRPDGMPAPALPIYIGPRPNKFLEMGLNNRHKQDTILQKKLSGDNQITERRSEIEFISAFCTECEYIFEDVNPNLVARDAEGAYFVCDDCQLSRAKNN